MLMRTLKEAAYECVQIFRIAAYNHIHKTEIYSVRASLNARYGNGIGVGKGTTVASNVIIGDMSYINENSWVENCAIGKWCSISDHVLICPTEHCIDRILSHPVLGNKKTAPVVLGNDVLVSHGVTILSGVHIGDGAVIAAGAVVTKDVGSYEIWGGVPARFIKQRFDEETVKKIKDAKIYDKPLVDIVAFEKTVGLLQRPASDKQ